MKKNLIRKIIDEGLKVNSYIIIVSRVFQGRFREERNIIFSISSGDYVVELLHMKVFFGRPPYYRPWIEVFNINNSILLGSQRINYFDSTVEDTILNFLASVLEPGERLFIEYYRDYETLKALEKGIPIVATRLGYKLLKRGFTWFKDWYYPEGFMEGNPKLQAEKPLSNNHRFMQLQSIYRELLQFINSTSSFQDRIISRAISRAKEVLEFLSKEIES